MTNFVSRRTRNTLHRCGSRPCLWHHGVLPSGLFWFLSLVSSPPFCPLLLILFFPLSYLSPFFSSFYGSHLSRFVRWSTERASLYGERGVGGSCHVLLSRPANGSSAVRVEPELAVVWASSGSGGTCKPKRKIIPPQRTVGGRRKLLQPPPPQTATKRAVHQRQIQSFLFFGA